MKFDWYLEKFLELIKLLLVIINCMFAAKLELY